MASLYKSAEQSRKIIILILVFFALVMCFSIYNSLISSRQVIPDEEIPSFFLSRDPIFGDLPSPEFNEILDRSNATYVYKDANSHDNSEFPSTAYVYQIDLPKADFNDLIKLEETVTAIGGFLDYEYTDSSGNFVEWKNIDSTKTFNGDLANRFWNLTTDFVNNEAANARKELLDVNSTSSDDEPYEAAYKEQGPQIINRLRLRNKPGFEEIVVQAELVQRGLRDALISLDFISEAQNEQYVHMSFFRNLPLIDLKPSNERPEGRPPELRNAIDQGSTQYYSKVYGNDPRYGQLNLLVSNELKDYASDIFELDFKDFEYYLDPEDIGVYSITTPDEAWTRVTRGEGALTFFNPRNQNYFTEYSDLDVQITRFSADTERTELAYYEQGYYNDGTWGGYALPIYVFRGEAQAVTQDGTQDRIEFAFYIEAIKRAQ